MRVNRKTSVDKISEDEPHPFDLKKTHPASSMLYTSPLKNRIQKELVDSDAAPVSIRNTTPSTSGMPKKGDLGMLQGLPRHRYNIGKYVIWVGPDEHYPGGYTVQDAFDKQCSYAIKLHHFKHLPKGTKLPARQTGEQELEDYKKEWQAKQATKSAPQLIKKKLKLLVKEPAKPAVKTQAPISAYKVGDRVEGEFKAEGYKDWYVGTIQKVLPNGKYRIKFDWDGEVWDRKVETLRKPKK